MRALKWMRTAWAAWALPRRRRAPVLEERRVHGRRARSASARRDSWRSPMGGRATSSWCPSMEDGSAQAVRKQGVEIEMHLQQEAHAIAGAVVDRQHGLGRELSLADA